MAIDRNYKLNTLIMAVIVCITALLGSVLPGYAAGNELIEITIPVEQKFTSAAKDPDISCVYTFTAMEERNPMPAGSSNLVYNFSLKGNQTTELGPLVFEHSGIFTYQMTQVSVNKENQYRRDEKIYTISVYVKEEEHGGLQAEVIAENNFGTKAAILKFTNSYLDEDPTETTEPDTKDSEPPATETQKPKPPGGGGDKNPGGGAGGSSNTYKAPGVKTGDTTIILPMITALLASLSILIFILFRKLKKGT